MSALENNNENKQVTFIHLSRRVQENKEEEEESAYLATAIKANSTFWPVLALVSINDTSYCCNKMNTITL